MRTAHILLAAPFVGLVALASTSARAEEGDSRGVVPAQSGSPDVARARDLDAFGAKAFREGRFRDAILFFSEAYRLGAPPIELWNLARCHERLAEVDAQVTLLERFVDASDVQPADRAEAQRVLDDVLQRPSTLVVDPGPRGGVVIVDGRRITPATVSPLVLSVEPGAHRVSVERSDGETSSVTVDAARGRALSVHPADDDDDVLVLAGSEPQTPQRASAALDFGAYLSRLGTHTAPIAPAASLAVRYTFLVRGRVQANVGLRFIWTQDRWASGTAPPPTVVGCAVPRDFVASDLGGLFTVGGSYGLTHRLRAGVEVGFGFDTLVASQAGGELFDATCDPSFGYRPSAHAGIELSYAVLPAMRVALSPALFDVHPAFGGARGDATSVWYRAGAALGLAVDL